MSLALRREARGAAEEVGDLADRRFAEHQHEHASEPHAESAVGRSAEAEEVEVEVQVLGVEALFLGLLDEHVDAVLALCAGREFGTLEEQVVALGEPRLVIAHVVKSADSRVVVGDEHELVAVGLFDVRRDLTLALGVKVAIRARNLVSTRLDGLDCFGERDAREGDRGNLNLEPEELFDLGAVLVGDSLEGELQQLFLHGHDVFVRVDPADLGVDRGVLGGVTARERGVSAEGGRNLEDLAEAGNLGHLLEELRALCQVGGLVAEVLQREARGVGLRRARHQLGRVQLDVVALDPVGAHRVLERGLHAEDEVVATLAQVDEAPVAALLGAAIGSNRGLWVGRGGNLEPGELDLNAAELDALVVLECSARGQEGAGGKARNELGQRERIRILLLLGVRARGGIHQLHGAGLIAKDDELHLLLIADGLYPSRDDNVAVGEALKFIHQYAFAHRPSLRGRSRGISRTKRRASTQELVTEALYGRGMMIAVPTTARIRPASDSGDLDTDGSWLTSLVDWSVSLMEIIGPIGAGIAIALENLFPPLPSEVILPMAGLTASRGTFTLFEALLWTTLGSIVGAFMLYGIGAWLGLERLRKVAVRVPLLHAEDVDRTVAWFERHGGKAVFFGRMIPIFRSLISIPAGVTRMPLWKFGLLTASGSLIWNSIFVLSGFYLGESWHVIEQYADILQYVVIALTVIGITWFAIVRVRAIAHTRAMTRARAIVLSRRLATD